MPIFGSDLKREAPKNSKSPIDDSEQNDTITPRQNRQSALLNRLDVQRVSFSSNKGNQQFETPPEPNQPRRTRITKENKEGDVSHRSVLSPVLQEKEEYKDGENNNPQSKMICDLGAMNRFLVSRED